MFFFFPFKFFFFSILHSMQIFSHLAVVVRFLYLEAFVCDRFWKRSVGCHGYRIVRLKKKRHRRPHWVSLDLFRSSLILFADEYKLIHYIITPVWFHLTTHVEFFPSIQDWIFWLHRVLIQPSFHTSLSHACYKRRLSGCTWFGLQMSYSIIQLKWSWALGNSGLLSAGTIWRSL